MSEPTKPLREMSREELLEKILSGDLTRGHAAAIEAQRDAAEERFVKVRVENDDLQEEMALNAKSITTRAESCARQLAEMQQKLNDNQGAGELLFTRGVYVGALGMATLCAVVLVIVGIWVFWP